MYQILIQKPEFPKGTYSTYMKTIADADNPTKKITIPFTATSVDELEEEYKKVLKTYTADQILAVNVLDCDITVDLTEVVGDDT